MAVIRRPFYNIPKIITLRDKLASNVLLSFHGYRHAGEDFDKLINTLQQALPTIPRDTLYQSVQGLAGVELLNEQIEELSWRLAGNMQSLRRGIVVPPWTQQLFAEWAPIQIMAVEKCQLKLGGQTNKDYKIFKPAALLHLRILGGLAAGHCLIKQWTEAYCRHLRLILGFSRYDKSLYRRDYAGPPSWPLHDILELTRLRFFGLITPEACRTGPDFDKLSCPGSCRKWNRALMQGRARLEKPCPKGFDLQTHPCWSCEIGYDQCRLGCHPRTYVLGTCHNCSGTNSYLDQTRSLTICVSCLAKEKMQRSRGGFS